MDSPIRKMQKRNDYNRHKLLRKIKRKREAEKELELHAAEKELRKKLRRLDKKPKFDRGKNNDTIYELDNPDQARLNPETGEWLVLNEYGQPIENHGGYMLPTVEITPQNNPNLAGQYINNVAQLTQGEKLSVGQKLLLPVKNYFNELSWRLLHPEEGPIGGKYTMPAIALAGLMGSDAALGAIDAAVEATGIPAFIANNPITTATIGAGIEAPMYSELIQRRLINGDNSGGLLQDAMDATIGLSALSRMPTVANNTYNLTKQGWNWADRNYVQPYRLYNKIGKTSPIPEELNPTVRTRLGDVEIDNPNLFYHKDKGDGISIFGRNGAFIKDGHIYPGKTSLPNQLDYVWWSKGKSYVDGNANRLVVTADDPNLIHVRSQNYPIGQWNGKSGFVTNLEYVSTNPINVRNSVFKYDPDYGYRKITTEPSTIDFNTARTAQKLPTSLDNAYMKAVQEGDTETILALRDLHFVENTPNNVAINEAGLPIDLYHGTNDNYTSIDLSKQRQNAGDATFGRGFYTTPIKEYALLYGDNLLHLYSYLKNPRHYKDMNPMEFLQERLAFGDDWATGNGIDGVIGNPSWKGVKGLTEYVNHKPTHVKSAEPVTYFKATDPEVLSGLFKAGDVIPLRMRDNFKRNDIRFGWLPWISTVGTGIGLSVASNQQAPRGIRTSLKQRK